MKTSENLSNIAAALSKAQGEMPAAPKDGKSNNGTYATLSSVISTASPILARHGLSFVQMPSDDTEAGYMALTTHIFHESGEWIKGTMRALISQNRGASEVQQAGSAISYLKRYALCAALGMSTEDNDGAQTAPQPRQQASRPAPAQAAQKRAPEAVQKASGEVVAINRALTAEYGFKASERDNAISFVGYLAGIPGLASTKDLTDSEARGVLKKLSACEDASSRSELVGKWADSMAQAGAA